MEGERRDDGWAERSDSNSDGSAIDVAPWRTISI